MIWPSKFAPADVDAVARCIEPTIRARRGGARRRFGPTEGATRPELGVDWRTLRRWRAWWREQFPLTPLWCSACALLMPPLSVQLLPASLFERFAGPALLPQIEPLMRLLVFLNPVTVRQGQPCVSAFCEGC